MKKLLLSFLPLLMVVLCGASASAQDFSATVSWDTPGAIKVLKGSSPAFGTEVEIAATATSYTVTEKEEYMFIPTAEYYIETATMDGASQTLTKDFTNGGYYYKLPAKYQSTKYNGKTVELKTAKYVVEGSFTLDVKNGAESITFQIQDANGGLTKTIKPQDGVNIIELRNVDKQLYMKGSGYPAPKFFTATNNGTDISQQTNGSYVTQLSANSNIVVALTDPGAEEKTYEVKIVFANDNPDCLSNIRDWTNSKFIYPSDLKDKGYTLTVAEGADLQFNLISDCTFNSISGNPEAALELKNATTHRYIVKDNVTITIDATTITYQTLSATVYVNMPDGITFSNSTLDTTTGAIKVAEVGEKAAGTVTVNNTTIRETTTEYTLSNISGKYPMVFFNIADGYYMKEGVLGHPSDKETLYITGTSAFQAAEAPVYISLGKIDNTASAKIYYKGPEYNGRIRAKFKPLHSDAETATFEGLKDEYLVDGWSTIKFDPNYDQYFEISLAQTASGLTPTVILDGETLSPAEDNLVYTAYIKDNSVLYVFFGNEVPQATTLSFLTAGDAHATLTYDGLTVTDFTEDIVNYVNCDYVLTPEAGTKVLVDGKEVTLTNGSYTFKPAAGSTTMIQLQTADFTTFALGLDPAAGSTVKSLSSIEVSISLMELADMQTGDMHMFDMVPNATDWISVGGVKVSGIEMGTMDEMTYSQPLTLTLARPITAAGDVKISIPAGVFFETFPNTDYTAYDRTAASRVNAAIDATVTIDPNFVYTWTFDPAAGSENDLPEDNLMISISLPQVKTLTSEAFAEAAGPWITFNGNPIKYSEDIYETPGWTYTQTMASWGKPMLVIEISKDYFTVAGELTIKADEGAFTVNGNEGSPAIDYTARFGKKVEYTYEFTPAAQTEISDWSEFTLTFPEAETVTYDEDNAYLVLSVGMSWGTMNFDVTTEGNKVTIKPISEGAPTTGTLSLRIGEGTFILDGVNPSDEIAATWSYVRNQPVNFEWQASPNGTIINEGYGIYPAIVYDELETVNPGENYSQIVVKWNGTALPELDYDNEDVMGASVFTEGYNALMIMAGGGELYDPTVSGKLSVSIPAGALSISGQPNPEAIEYTWNVVPKKEYEVVVTPADGSTVKEISEILVEYTNAETAELGEYYNIGWFSLWSGYSKIANATSVEAVAGAEHPTFKVTFETVTTAGNYRITIGDGAFYIDNQQASEWIELQLTVDPNATGIADVEVADGLYTVYNLQGILVVNEGSADDVKNLPTGIYIVNGKKVVLK